MANPFKDALIEYTDNAIKNRKLEIINALKTNWAKDSLAALPRNAGIGALIGAGINGTRGAIKGWRDAAAKTTIKPRNLWLPEERIKASLEDKVWGAMVGGGRGALRGAGIGAVGGALSSPLSPVLSAAKRYYSEPRRIQSVTDKAIAGAEEFLNLDRDMTKANLFKHINGSVPENTIRSLKERYDNALSNMSMVADTPAHGLAIMSKIKDILNTKVDPKAIPYPDKFWARGLIDTYSKDYFSPAELNRLREEFNMTPLRDLRYSLKTLASRIF